MWAGRPIAWLSRRPPGRSSAWIRWKYSDRRARPTCSNMPMELTASYGPSRCRGSPGAGPRPGRSRPASATRLVARSCWLREIVTPTACTPCSSAACMHHRAPARSDVEQAHARARAPSLRADQLVLRPLRVLERRSSVSRPHRARVRHRRSEQHAVEVVRQVVVVRDRRGIACRRVEPSRAGAPPRAVVGAAATTRGPASPQRRCDCRAESSFTSAKCIAQLECGEHVAVDVEVAGDVGTREAQLAGCGDDAAKRVGGPDDDRRRWRRPGRGGCRRSSGSPTGRSVPMMRPRRSASVATAVLLPADASGRPSNCLRASARPSGTAGCGSAVRVR